jgi:hypothetical protein
MAFILNLNLNFFIAVIVLLFQSQIKLSLTSTVNSSDSSNENEILSTNQLNTNEEEGAQFFEKYKHDAQKLINRIMIARWDTFTPSTINAKQFVSLKEVLMFA